MKKKFLAIFLIGAMMAALFGCSKESGGTGKEVSPSPQENGSDVTSGTTPDDATPSATEPPKKEFDGETLVWVLPDLCNVTKEQTEAFNERLDEEGYDFHVKFVQVDFTNYEEELTKLVEKSKENPENAAIDIASSGFISGTGNAGLLRSGIFMPLEEMLLEAPEFYNHYSEKLWEMVKVDGVIYAVPNTGGYTTTIDYVFNKEYFTEEQADAAVLSLSGISPLLASMPQKDGFSPLIIDEELLQFSYGLGVYQKGGLFYTEDGKISTMYDCELLQEYFQTLRSYYQSGYLKNAFSLEYMATTPELRDAYKLLPDSQAETMIKNKSFGILIESNYMQKYDSDGVIVRSATNVLHGTTSGSVGIASVSQHPQEAFMLLQAFMTSTELQRIMLLEDEELNGENADELYYDYLNRALAFGTKDLFYPDYEARNEAYDAMTLSVFCGFHPEYTCDASTLASITQTNTEYMGIWCLDDYEYWLEQMEAQLRELGAEELKTSIQEQYARAMEQ